MVIASTQNYPVLVYSWTWYWALKQSVSKRIVFTRAGVMVLGQKLISEVPWPVWYRRSERSWWSLGPFKSMNLWSVNGNQIVFKIKQCLFSFGLRSGMCIWHFMLQRLIWYSAWVGALPIPTESFLYHRLYCIHYFKYSSTVSMVCSTLSLA